MAPGELIPTFFFFWPLCWKVYCSHFFSVHFVFFGIISHFKISSCMIIIDEARTCETQLRSPPPWLLSALLAGSILRILHMAVPRPQPLPLAPAVSLTLHTKAFNGKFDKNLRFTQTLHLVTVLLSLRQLQSITFLIQKGQNFK